MFQGDGVTEDSAITQIVSVQWLNISTEPELSPQSSKNDEGIEHTLSYQKSTRGRG